MSWLWKNDKIQGMAEVGSWKRPFHQARRSLAKLWLLLNPQLTIIGITGSYGKTNTATAIASVLREKYPTIQSDLNLDTIYNLPITLLKVRPWHRQLVLEMGVDHRGEMDFHLSLVKPTIGVVTGITPVHSEAELLGSLGGIIEEKGKLLASLPPQGLAVLNWDDPYVKGMAAKTKAKVIRYGIENREADYNAVNIKVDFKGTSFNIVSKSYLSNKVIQVKTELVGRHFVHSCLAAAIAAIHQGLSWSEIKVGLLKSKPLKGRLSIEKGYRGSTLINDALRANPVSTIAGLRVLTDLPTKGKRIAVLGEMGELGQYAQQAHRQVGQEVANLKIDYLVSIGPLQKLTAQEAINSGMDKSRVFWENDVFEAAEVLKKLIKKDDLWYLKGSLLRHMERIILLLRGNKIGCKKISCHFYSSCLSCPSLQST